jgi:hypothetical protein
MEEETEIVLHRSWRENKNVWYSPSENGAVTLKLAWLSYS